jgi:hypothetical protein
MTDAQKEPVKRAGELTRQNAALLKALTALRDAWCQQMCTYYRSPPGHSPECLDATAAIQIARGR